MQSKCCPTCKRPFPPAFDAGGPVSQRIYEYIAKHPEGVTRGQVIDWVYADRIDGGPEWASGISTMLVGINKRLAKIGMKIKSRGGPGSIYSLVPVGETDKPSERTLRRKRALERAKSSRDWLTV